MSGKKTISLNDALMIKTNLIQHWKPAVEVWPFFYGDDVIGCLTVLGSIFVTSAFRKALNLRPYARLTSYIPVVGLSSMGCYGFQSHIISADIIAANSCPLCISTKAIVAQALIGSGFPVLFAPIVCFYLADRLLTYPVPPLARAPWEVYSIFKKIIMKNSKPILSMAALQIATTWFITYQKQKSFSHIESSLKGKNTVDQQNN